MIAPRRLFMRHAPTWLDHGLLVEPFDEASTGRAARQLASGGRTWYRPMAYDLNIEGRSCRLVLMARASSIDEAAAGWAEWDARYGTTIK